MFDDGAKMQKSSVRQAVFTFAIRPQHWAAMITIGLCSGLTALASPPTNPVATPLFTFDRNSPSVLPPNPFVRSDEVLRIVIPDEPPVRVFDPVNLGLGQPNDDLNAVSFSKSSLTTADQFVIMFSVDRSTSGDVPPNPLLLLNETPFNVADQAARGHAAGDAFVTLVNYTVNGPVARGLRGTPESNTQAKNQYDEGGHDFSAKPETSSRDYTAGAIDGVDGLAYETPEAARGVPGPQAVYYAVAPLSPSLATLPGNSPADIFYHPNPQTPGIPPQRFASAMNMGLQNADDVNALVILDNDDNGIFNLGDIIFFSLAPGSPSLTGPTAIPNISSNGAADILSVRFKATGVTLLEVFAPAAELGLIGDFDNVDALEIVFCTDPLACGADVGIRLERGDWNNDALVNILDLPNFVSCLTGPNGPAGIPLFDPICIDVFDFNSDDTVDLQDFFSFQVAFTP